MPTAKKNPIYKKHPGRQSAANVLVRREFREAVADLLQANAHQLTKWLAEVAEGSAEFGRAPDPARALDLLSKLAEYAAPKLGRIEYSHTGDARNVTTIEVEFVDATPIEAKPKQLQ